MRSFKTAVSSLAFAALSMAQTPDLRGLIERTQHDLRRSEEFERHKGKEVSRYENAQHHLSEFDKDLTRGHFDKGKLDEAIEDVRNVVDHNTLNPDARDVLRNDLRDLRLARTDHESK